MESPGFLVMVTNQGASTPVAVFRTREAAEAAIDLLSFYEGEAVELAWDGLRVRVAVPRDCQLGAVAVPIVAGGEEPRVKQLFD